MIGFFRGKVAYVALDNCLLDVNGVGYRVFVAGNTQNKLRIGEEIQLFTYLSVREDAMQLFGFIRQEEYHIFLQLLSVSGIGPKVALGIIGNITPAKLCQAIQNKQASVLTKLPGIGKKSAERMIVELKDKLSFVKTDNEVIDEPGSLFAASPVGEDALSEANAALVSLGFPQQQVTPVLEQLANTAGEADVQTLIKLALKELSGR